MASTLIDDDSDIPPEDEIPLEKKTLRKRAAAKEPTSPDGATKKKHKKKPPTPEKPKQEKVKGKQKVLFTGFEDGSEDEGEEGKNQLVAHKKEPAKKESAPKKEPAKKEPKKESKKEEPKKEPAKKTQPKKEVEKAHSRRALCPARSAPRSHAALWLVTGANNFPICFPKFPILAEYSFPTWQVVGDPIKPDARLLQIDVSLTKLAEAQKASTDLLTKTLSSPTSPTSPGSTMSTSSVSAMRIERRTLCTSIPYPY